MSSQTIGFVDDIEFAERAVERVENRPRLSAPNQADAGTKTIDQRFVSFRVARNANTSSAEFDDLQDYQYHLHWSNNPDVLAEDEVGFDDFFEADDPNRPMAKTIDPENTHITHIYAADAHTILMHAFGDDRGRFRHLSKVKQKVRSMKRQYNIWVEDRNSQLQAQTLQDAGILSTHPSRVLCGQEMDDNTVLKASNGFFDTKEQLAGVGDGRKFALVFQDEARKFLENEREASLEFILGRLGIRALDSELEDSILGKTHHVTLIKKRGEGARSVIYPTDIHGEEIRVPREFTTQFDPVMEYVGDDKSRTT